MSAATSTRAKSQLRLGMNAEKFQESFSESCAGLPIDLGVLVKTGLLLWTLVAVSTVLDCLNTRRPTEKKVQVALATKETGLFNRVRSQKAWHNPYLSEGEMGAMQDSNMKRLNDGVDLQELVNSAPAGYDKPYRSRNF